MSAIFFSRFLSPLPIDVRIQQTHTIETEITELAVEDGSTVNDHALIKPARYKIEFASQAAALSWQRLKQINKDRKPFTIVSGLDIYTNMLINMATARVDKDNDQILRGEVELQEVLFAETAYYAVPDSGGGGTQAGKPGAPGGAGSTRAAAPSAGNSSDPDIASGTDMRGGSASSTVSPGISGTSGGATTQSAAYGMLYGG